jgi:hypothetical protein
MGVVADAVKERIPICHQQMKRFFAACVGGTITCDDAEEAFPL